jgi:hypothetical protein
MKVTYSIGVDYRTGDYQIVRWEGSEYQIVQTSIRTRGKAMAAADGWRQRERQKKTPASSGGGE